MAVEIRLEKVSYEDKAVLRNLLELYMYDFSEFREGDNDVNEHGLYGYKYLDHYWTEPGRHPFLVRVGTKLAGFVLVRTTRMSDESTCYSTAEFFIMRKYRHQGIGQAVAFQVFDMFPGRWRVA